MNNFLTGRFYAGYSTAVISGNDVCSATLGKQKKLPDDIPAALVL
jgi:hypothetical protein